MNKIENLANTYGSYHESKINQIFHMIGVPIIIISLVIATNWLSLTLLSTWHLQISWLLILALCIYYFTLDKQMSVIMLVFYVVLNALVLVLMHFITFQTQAIVALAFFIIGWGLNFIGHAIEGKKPAFLHNLLQTLISPVFLLDEFFQLFNMNVYSKTTTEE